MALFFAVAAVPIVLLYIYALSRNVGFGWACLLAAFFYDYTFGTDTYNIAGLNLKAIDLIQICLLAAGVIRTIPRLGERSAGRNIVLGYLAVFSMSFLRGVSAHGFAHAANGARLFVGLLIALLYFLTAPVDVDSVRKYVHYYMYYALGLTMVAILAYAGVKIGGVLWVHGDPILEVGLDGTSASGYSGLGLRHLFLLFAGGGQLRPKNGNAEEVAPRGFSWNLRNTAA